MTAADVQAALRRQAKPAVAKSSAWFFRTGPGEYGEGDKFIGVKVPVQRRIGREFRDLPLYQSLKLLRSPVHEDRLTSVIIMADQYQRAARNNNRALQQAIGAGLLKNRRWINNWDIVDTIAPAVLGPFLLPSNRKLHRKLAHSNQLWDRRIAMIATYPFIKQGAFSDALYTANVLVRDQHDLIQKAVGWMLREIGNRDQPTLIVFLNVHAKHMPRTMLRYAIEKFPETLRRRYLSQ